MVLLPTRVASSRETPGQLVEEPEVRLDPILPPIDAHGHMQYDARQRLVLVQVFVVSTSSSSHPTSGSGQSASKPGSA